MLEWPWSVIATPNQIGKNKARHGDQWSPQPAAKKKQCQASLKETEWGCKSSAPIKEAEIQTRVFWNDLHGT